MPLPEWLHINGEVMGWFALVAASSWALTLVVVPLIIARMPVDYFTRDHRHPMYVDSLHPVLGWLLATVKNLVGALLVMAGILMIFTPGQGMMMIVVGLLLVNFPGKFAVERWVVMRPGVMRSLNWLRAKADKAPLDPPQP